MSATPAMLKRKEFEDLGDSLHVVADSSKRDVRVIVAVILGVAAITVARLIADAIKPAVSPP